MGLSPSDVQHLHLHPGLLQFLGRARRGGGSVCVLLFELKLFKLGETLLRMRIEPFAMMMEAFRAVRRFRSVPAAGAIATWAAALVGLGGE